MNPLVFRAFYEDIATRTEKENYKYIFMKESHLSYPAVYAYLNNNVKKIPFMAAKKIIEIAYRLHPALALIHFPVIEPGND